MMTMVDIMIWPNLHMKPVPGKGQGGERHQTCHHRSALEHTHPPADQLELDGSFLEGNAKQDVYND